MKCERFDHCGQQGHSADFVIIHWFPSVSMTNTPSMNTFVLCRSCWEQMIAWTKGDGEFHHVDWERKMLEENIQILTQLHKRSWIGKLLGRLLGEKN